MFRFASALQCTETTTSSTKQEVAWNRFFQSFAIVFRSLKKSVYKQRFFTECFPNLLFLSYEASTQLDEEFRCLDTLQVITCFRRRPSKHMPHTERN